MPAQEHLSLRLRRLKTSDTWAQPPQGLTFLFPISGAGEYISSRGAQPLAAGEVVVLNGQTGRVQTADREFVFGEFDLCLEHLFPLFDGTEISVLQNVIQALATPRFYPPRSRLALECHRLLKEVPPQSGLAHRSQLLRLAACILAEEFRVARGSTAGGLGHPEAHTLKVCEALSVSELRQSTVGELARRFGCSRRHLNRLFHQHFGCSVAALRMEIRLLSAVSLLRDPDIKVIDVAEQCGFNHLGLFNTCFKRRFGLSPGQWRKTNFVQVQAVHATNEPLDCRMRANGLCPWSGRETSMNTGAPSTLVLRVAIPSDGATVSAHTSFKTASPEPVLALGGLLPNRDPAVPAGLGNSLR